MARPTWTLTGPLSAPHGAVLAGTELTLSLVPGVSRDPSGSDLRAGSTVAVVGADGTLTVKGTGDPVMLLASSPDAPVHYRLSCIPRVLPTVTFTAPEGGSLALDDIVPEVPAPVPAVDASTLRAEWQAALAGKAALAHTHAAASISDATTEGRALLTGSTLPALDVWQAADGSWPSRPTWTGRVQWVGYPGLSSTPAIGAGGATAGTDTYLRRT